ncbi:uncharacterized protein LOC144024180 [Festucalex cinctus]
MAFVRFTDDFFNEMFQPLHDNGPFFMSLPEMTFPKSAALDAFGLRPGPLEVELRKPVAVSIHKTGVTIRIDARARSHGNRHELIVKSQVSMKVDIKENQLVLLHGSAKCKIGPSTLWGKVFRRCARKKLEEVIESKLKKLIDKMVIPGVVNIVATISYYEGSLEIGGNLSLIPELIQEILKRYQTKRLINL